MKILLVIEQYYDANNGMVISARRFAKILREHGHEVRILSNGKPTDSPYALKTKKIPILNGIITAQGFAFPKVDMKIYKKAMEWADLVHFLSPFGMSHKGILLARKMEVPYTAAFHVQPENMTSSVHMAQFEWFNNLIYWWFKNYVYKYCTHVHCPSKFIANELIKRNYYSSLHVISNGIDPDFVYNKVEKPEKYQDKFVILTIGRLSIEKRQDVLIDAINLSKYKDKIQLLIAGKGPRKEQLIKQGESLTNPLEVNFYTHDELLDVIAMSDLYVHPAQVEIEAMSCMEAFAGGLVPIIANSNKSATPQFALDGRSLFTSGDARACAAKIDYWIEHEQERKEMEHKYAELGQKYNLEKCVTEAEKMFDMEIEDFNNAKEEGTFKEEKKKRVLQRRREKSALWYEEKEKKTREKEILREIKEERKINK